MWHPPHDPRVDWGKKALIVWVLLILILILTAFLCGCATINLDEKQFYGRPLPFSGMSDEEPPASLNPPVVVIPRDYHKTNYEFYQQVMKFVEKSKREIIKVHFDKHSYGGIRWKQGDYREAWVYYRVEE